MSVSDDEFHALVAAWRANPDAEVLAEAVQLAAHSPVRRALVKALSLEQIKPTDDLAGAGDECPNATSTGVGNQAAFERGNVIALATLRQGRTSVQEVVSLEDVGGLEAVKTQLRRKLLDPLQHPGLFQKFKRRSGGGILLYGPPGCGKTMVVKAVANEADVRLIEVHAAEVLDGQVGASERKLAAAFAEARASRPCILFFDEVEALAGRRAVGSDFKAGLVSSFLTAFDGLADRNNGILVLAATNTPWAIDPAFRRPGRFDRTLFVPPPDRSAREVILRSQLRNRPTATDVAIGELATVTSSFSGADVVNLIETTIDLVIEDCIKSGGGEQIEMRHFRAAIREVQPSVTEWLAIARNYAKYSNEGGTYNEVLAFLDRHAA
jgi:SpoVK/Ycf46/Vps4 family AAA+-type ATPase